MANRIREINVRLDKIATERRDLHLETRCGSRQLDFIKEQCRSVSSVRDESLQVFGREEDAEQVIKCLLSDDSSEIKFSVIAIVGTGGIGKTTLARVVYNDRRVAQAFEIRAWVCVSEQFDVKKITKEIIASAGKSNCDLSDIDALQCALRDKLNGKKFLLVLDDLWNENDGYSWEVLQAPFAFGAKGSKILIPTRSQAVSNAMQATFTRNLKGLSRQDCWSLFVSRAFHNGDLNTYPDLMNIGEVLVGRCGGLPLAVKALGGLLSSKREVTEWENILESSIWELEEPASKIMPILRLSYQNLSAHLKRCFTFCSIFPKDYVFYKDALVQLWVAHGFIHPKDGKQIEDIGFEYFNDLLLRSFFQSHCEGEEEFEDTIFDYCDEFYWMSPPPSMNSVSRNWTSYKMHDLFHDLAKSISTDACFLMEHGKSHLHLQKIRHLSCNREPIKFESFYELKGLRTFLSFKIIKEKVPNEIFERLMFIRVLDLSWIQAGELPNSIGCLRHLRYLNLSCSGIKQLPESICGIRSLQALILQNCSSLEKLPNEMRKLTNLRHLDLEGSENIVSMPPQIGRLIHLKKLPLFIVSKEKGKGIAELKEIRDIRGKLVIKQLKKVTNAEHARQADLRNKPLIDQLSLVWSEDNDDGLQPLVRSEDYDDSPRDERLEEKVAIALKPHPNLKALGFWGYMGAHFPSWIIEAVMVLPNLEALLLIDCRLCSMLPPLGHLPSLSCLVIDGLDEVKQIESWFCGMAGGFPSLKDMHLRNMFNLEQWQETEEGDFPCLQRLCILNCPMLRQVPYNPCANLTYLHINSCDGLISLPPLSSLKELILQDLDNLERWCDVGEADFPRLQKLSISFCPKMTRWPNILSVITELDVFECCGFDALPLLPSLCKLELGGDGSDRLLQLVPCLTSLTFLTIRSINSITTIPQGILQALTQLEILEVWDCQELVTLLEENGFQDEDLPSTLTYLHFGNCPNLKSLPRGLNALSSLQTLYIANCPSVTSLPEEGLPPTLQRLVVSKCPVLKETFLKNSGEGWLERSNIPGVYMR